MDKNDIVKSIELNKIFARASIALQEKQLPNHNAFTISEVIGVITGLPKEYVIDQILK